MNQLLKKDTHCHQDVLAKKMDLTIHCFIETLDMNQDNMQLDELYQTYILNIKDVREKIEFKHYYEVFIKQSHQTKRHIMKDILTSYYLDMNHVYNSSSQNRYHSIMSNVHVQTLIFQYLQKTFNTYIKDTYIILERWHQHYVDLHPKAFILEQHTNKPQNIHDCVSHDRLCLTHNQYQDIIKNYDATIKTQYVSSIKKQHRNSHRHIHIWQFDSNIIQHVTSHDIIPILNREELYHVTPLKKTVKRYILPIPEDVVELESWIHKYIKPCVNEQTFIVWLKHDTLLSHYKSIPKNIEVIIDLNAILLEVFDMNPIQPITLPVFKHIIVPILREIHQTYRIKKIKHYIYGYPLYQPDILHRCFTLGFRHIIAHSPCLPMAIHTSLQFMNKTSSKI